MSEKSPAFRLYAADFMADQRVRLMDYEALGVYFMLILEAWVEGSIPSDPDAIARLLRIPPRSFGSIWTQVKDCWKPGDAGRLVQPRLEIERKKQADNRDRQRENGAKGGRPANPPQSQSKADANPDKTQKKPAGLQNESQTKAKRKPAGTRFSFSSSESTESVNTDSAEAENEPEGFIPTPMPPGLPTALPDDLTALKRLAMMFLSEFGNARSREAQAEHGPAYTETLAIFRSRGATTADAWTAFAEARFAQNGKPLFRDLARKAVSYLRQRPRGSAAPQNHKPTVIPEDEYE